MQPVSLRLQPKNFLSSAPLFMQDAKPLQGTRKAKPALSSDQIKLNKILAGQYMQKVIEKARRASAEHPGGKSDLDVTLYEAGAERVIHWFRAGGFVTEGRYFQPKQPVKGPLKELAKKWFHFEGGKLMSEAFETP